LAKIHAVGCGHAFAQLDIFFADGHANDLLILVAHFFTTVGLGLTQQRGEPSQAEKRSNVEEAHELLFEFLSS
jgi:hypothetical protein